MLDLKERFICSKCKGYLTKPIGQESPCNFCGNKDIIKQSEDLMNIEEAKLKFRESFDNMISFMKGYVDMPEEYYKFTALWISGTYFHEEFNTFPFLFINAMRGSGKTRLLKIISHLQKNGNGDIQNNISEAVLFRTAKERGLIIDEFEGIGSKDKNTLRELLNAAYKKGGKVRRMKKKHVDKEEKQVVEEFDLFSPIAMANIWGMEEVLEDRCVTLTLEKSTNQGITKKMENFENHPLIIQLKEVLNRTSCSLCSYLTKKNYVECWNNYIDTKYSINTNYIHTLHTYTTHNYITTLTREEELLFEKIDELGLEGRNLELFLPLILIAQFLDEISFTEILKICRDLAKSKKVEEVAESKDISLYEFVAHSVQYRFNKVYIGDITREFKEFIGYTADNNDNWLNEKWVGRGLKRLNLLLSRSRASKGIQVTINPEKAKEKLKIFKEFVSKEDI